MTKQSINPKKWVQENSNKFDVLKGKFVKIKINGKQITSNATFQYLAPTKIGDLGSLAPDKVQTEDGKFETPKCFDIVFDQGTLTFVIKDTHILVTMHGVTLSIGEDTIDLEVYT